MPKREDPWGERALRELLGSEARAKIIAHTCSQHTATPIVGAKLARELDLAPNAAPAALRRTSFDKACRLIRVQPTGALFSLLHTPRVDR